MDRRSFLASGTALTALSLAPAARAGQAPAPGMAPQDAPLARAFDRVLQDTLRNSPELATGFGLDTGANADLRGRLSDNSPGALRHDLVRERANLATIAAVPSAGLTEQGRLDREVLLYQGRQTVDALDRFGRYSPQAPYRITQQNGAYFGTPDFLASQHPVKTAADAEAYLARLAQFPAQLDNDTAATRADLAGRLVAPGFILDQALTQLAALRAPAAAENGLTTALTTRARAAGLTADYGPRAAKLVADAVYPALDRQIAVLTELRRGAREDAGLWAVRDGDAMYAAALAEATTTTMSPDEIHRLGLATVADLNAQLEPILAGEGMTRGTLGERLTALNASPSQLYPDTDAGRAALLASLNEGVAAMQAKLPHAFNAPPNAPLEIRRVDPSIQDGASNGYYYNAPLDGSRPAIYWINLKSTTDWPKYSLPSLTYHEGVPGHHLQISVALQAPTHPLRKLAFFGAYLEGWALYAEQLADELGGYATPIERAGYLQSFLFRAARLVVDTGIHSKRWTRAQATDYFIKTVGFTRPRSQREIDRYCVSVGQACSYKVGHAAWLRARANAQKIAGDRFDLRRFHDILAVGALPLSMLETLVEQRARDWAAGRA